MAAPTYAVATTAAAARKTVAIFRLFLLLTTLLALAGEFRLRRNGEAAEVSQDK